MARKTKQLKLKNILKKKRETRGRKRLTKSGNHHGVRPEFSSRHPLHVTIRVRKNVPNLRKKELFKAFRNSVRRARGNGFKIIHFSLLSNHCHMLIESKNKKDLERVMKSLLISFALKLKALRVTQSPSAHQSLSQKQAGRATQSRGTNAPQTLETTHGLEDSRVFEGRYDLHVLKTPTETRNALRYVLFNEEKHRSIRPSELRFWSLSPFQTCHAFTLWSDLLNIEFRLRQPAVVPPEIEEVKTLLASPGTWLLREGWKRAA